MYPIYLGYVLNIYIMKIIIKGNEKKIKQLIRELKPRVKLDKLIMNEVDEQKETKKIGTNKKKKITKKY